MSKHFKNRITRRINVQTASDQNRKITIDCAKALPFDFKNDLNMRNAQSVHRWPFEFKIPWTSLPVAHNPRILGPHPWFEHEPGLPLPTSTDHRKKNGIQEIKYYLEVIGNAPSLAPINSEGGSAAKIGRRAGKQRESIYITSLVNHTDNQSRTSLLKWIIYISFTNALCLGMGWDVLIMACLTLTLWALKLSGKKDGWYRLRSVGRGCCESL